MKKLFKVLAFVLMMACVMTCFTGCLNASETVNHNLSQAADNFQVMRKITVYNARTDCIILEMEGLMSISNDAHSELVVTCKTGPDSYKKNYVYLNEYVLYVVEDINGTTTNPYHYKVHFYTPVFDPDVNH